MPGEKQRTVKTRAHALVQGLVCALASLLLSLSLASAQPSDVGHLIRSENLEEKVLIPFQIETSLKELNSQPKEVNLQTILAPYAGSRTQLQAVLNLLSGSGGPPGDLSVSVRLLDSRLFDDRVVREYRDRLATFAYTGCSRDGYKFFQQSGDVPIRHDLWQSVCDSGSEESEQRFSEARAGGEVVLVDGVGKVYRLTRDFSFTKLLANGIDGVALLGDTTYGAITAPGQTLGSFVSTDNGSTFELSQAIPTIYAFSLRRKGDEAPGTTLQYYVSVGISSPQGDNAEPLFSLAAIIPIQVTVAGDAEDCGDGVDNDSDGMVDCGDSDCSGSGNCIKPPEDCSNGWDDDGDGAADCSDSDCYGSPRCVASAENCADGIDNDADGSTDCNDSDCQYTYWCTSCSAECPYGGGTCNCSNSWWGWGSCSCDCSQCPQPTPVPEIVNIQEGQGYSLPCLGEDFTLQASIPQSAEVVVYLDGMYFSNLGWVSGQQDIRMSLSPGMHQVSLYLPSVGTSVARTFSVYQPCSVAPSPYDGSVQQGAADTGSSVDQAPNTCPPAGGSDNGEEEEFQHESICETSCEKCSSQVQACSEAVSNYNEIVENINSRLAIIAEANTEIQSLQAGCGNIRFAPEDNLIGQSDAQIQLLSQLISQWQSELSMYRSLKESYENEMRSAIRALIDCEKECTSSSSEASSESSVTSESSESSVSSEEPSSEESSSESSSESSQGDKDAEYCGDGFCYPIEENPRNCPEDCAPDTECGNGVCDPGEEDTCWADCADGVGYIV